MKRLSEQIRRVGMVANPDKPEGRRAFRRAAALIVRAGRQVFTDMKTAKVAPAGLPTSPDVAALAARCDLLVVFGGDGTILRVARESAGAHTPILGINLGTLGFLTTGSAGQLGAVLRQVWAGQCRVEERLLIQARLPGQRSAPRELALNDFVISRGAVPRLIELEVKVDGDLLTSYRGDGLIVSSATGSTAYSLAAGGAVVSPQAEVFALTPICPHTLSSRSVIVRSQSTIEVKLLSKRVETFLAADGQVRGRIEAGQVVSICAARHTTRLVRLPGASFFGTLRCKLNWSGSSL